MIRFRHSRRGLSSSAWRRRRAVSLLEVVAATCLLATAIYPALQFVRDGLAISRDNETRAAVSNFCVSKLEEHLALAAANWTNGTYTGNFASEGYASLRYSVTRSDAVAAGGVVGSLMAITVTVWNDANANSLCDTGETQVTMASKISKMAVYQALGS